MTYTDPVRRRSARQPSGRRKREAGDEVSWSVPFGLAANLANDPATSGADERQALLAVSGLLSSAGLNDVLAPETHRRFLAAVFDRQNVDRHALRRDGAESFLDRSLLRADRFGLTDR